MDPKKIKEQMIAQLNEYVKDFDDALPGQRFSRSCLSTNKNEGLIMIV